MVKVGCPRKKVFTLERKLSVVYVINLLTQKRLSDLIEDSRPRKRMNRRKNNQWHASISKDSFITAFVKGDCVNRKFELSVLMIWLGNLNRASSWYGFISDSLLSSWLYLFEWGLLYVLVELHFCSQEFITWNTIARLLVYLLQRL